MAVGQFGRGIGIESLAGARRIGSFSSRAHIIRPCAVRVGWITSVHPCSHSGKAGSAGLVGVTPVGGCCCANDHPGQEAVIARTTVNRAIIISHAPVGLGDRKLLRTRPTDPIRHHQARQRERREHGGDDADSKRHGEAFHRLQDAAGRVATSRNGPTGRDSIPFRT
jgi:hypothetical protein